MHRCLHVCVCMCRGGGGEDGQFCVTVHNFSWRPHSSSLSSKFPSTRSDQTHHCYLLNFLLPDQIRLIIIIFYTSFYQIRSDSSLLSSAFPSTRSGQTHHRYLLNFLLPDQIRLKFSTQTQLFELLKTRAFTNGKDENERT